MKVPSLVTNRVVENSKPLAYLQAAPNAGAGFQMFGRSLQEMGAVFEQRQEKTDRFNALTNLSKFDGELNQQQDELKRSASADGKDFAKQSQELFDKQAESFINTSVPKDMQDEFRLRLSEKRNAIVGDAFKFQYAASDAWYKQNISDQLNTSAYAISRDPSALEGEQKKLDELISTSDLPEIEKAGLKQQINISLLATQYKQVRKSELTTELKTGIPAKFDSGEAGAMAILQKFESFRGTPYWDVTALRTGFGSDTVTRANGKVEKVGKDTVVSKEEANLDLQRRITDVEGKKAREQVGENWNKLAPNVQAGLYSVAYNYGSLPSFVLAAAKTGDPEKIAQAVENLNANKGRRRQEAAIIRGSAAITQDPKYDAIPFDDRTKLDNDAEREAKQDYTLQAQQDKQIQQEKTNGLFTNLYDGKAGATDIQKARDEGWLTDYDEIKKANTILGDRTETSALAQEGIDIINKGGIFDPTNPRSNKIGNAMMKLNDGVGKLTSGDKDFVTSQIVPLAQQFGMIPTDIAGALQGMVRSANLTRAGFALDTMAQLRDANPAAYETRFPESVKAQVDQWDGMKETAINKDELLGQVLGGRTAQDRQNKMTLEKEARSILTKVDTSTKLPKIDQLVNNLVDSYDNSWTSDPHAYTNPSAKMGLYKDFQSAFVQEYSVYGDVDKAAAAAQKRISGQWGLSPVGDRQTLMKYPPDKMGYAPGADGTFSWIDKEIKSTLSAPAFTSVASLSPQESALLQYHRDNLTKGTFLKNGEDITTVYITGVTGPDGKIYNVPGYADGKMLTPDQAAERASKIGWDKFPAYADGPAADKAAESLHKIIERDMELYNAQPKVDRYELFSDDTTKSEFDKHRANPDERPPSYRIFAIDENGVAREKLNDQGRPIRMWFQQNAAEVKQKEEVFDLSNEKKVLEQRLTDIVGMKMNIPAQSGKQLPDEILKEEEQIRQNLKVIDTKLPAVANPYVAKAPNRMDAFKQRNK